MTRETRGSASAGTSDPTDASASTKRKRQPSVQADQPKPTPIKVTLPSPASLQTVPKVKLNISPSKDAPGAKRQRISLKVNGSKTGKPGNKVKNDLADEGLEHDEAVEEGVEVGGDDVEDEAAVKEDEVDEQEAVVNALGRDVRDALALVLSQMATNLPRPLNTVLTLFLPPSFEQKQENTLAYILKQGSLTWERLVDILHIFSTHLLQPCAYPSPFPPLSHIHASIPPLPPHQPPHAIYDFCLSLRDLVLAIEPGRRELDSTGTELARLKKWALMMKVPPGGAEQKGGGEWWTGVVDWREVEKVKSKAEGDEDQGVLATLAEDGNKFGFANAVSIASVAGTIQSMATVPKLGASIIQAASLKAQEWREMLKRRKGGFGSYYKPVTIPRSSTLQWTPSFAPSFDSHFASGGVGYWSTLEAMHQRNRYQSWKNASKEMDAEAAPSEGYWGSIDVKPGEKSVMNGHADGQKDSDIPEEKVKRETSDVLGDNAAWLDELLGWQEVRAREGEMIVGDREDLLANELLTSLSHLSGNTTPSDLLPNLQPGFAHSLSKRLIHAPGPVHRGTLDPRRPQAMHDNTTIRARPIAPAAPPSIAQQLAGTPTRQMSGQINPYTPSPNYQNAQNQQGRQSYGYSGTPQSASYANGQTPQSARQPYYPPGAVGNAYRPQTPAYQQYTPQPQVPNGNNTMYNRSPVPMQPQVGSPTAVGLAPQNQYTRPGMMPSGLRQSFGPGTEGGAGNLTGGGYYAGMNRTN